MLKHSLIAVLVIASVGCGKETSKPEPQAKPSGAEPAPAPAPSPATPAAPKPAEPAATEVARAPTADEIARCTSLLEITAACGVHDDHEFGWVKAKPKQLSAADVRKQCSVDKHVNEEGMSAFPVKLLKPDQLAKVEAASKQDCKAVLAALDEVDPRIGPAGHDPSK